MNCTQLTDNTFQEMFVRSEMVNGGSWIPKEFATIDDALAYYLCDLCQKFDPAVGVVYAAAVVEEGSHLHVHSVFWTAKKLSFDYCRKIVPGVHYADCQKRLSLNVDYLYKRNGFEDKAYTNRSSVVEYGEYPITEDCSVPSEWINFVKAGHTYVELIDAYPSALGRAYGLKVYINECKERQHDYRRNENPGKS